MLHGISIDYFEEQIQYDSLTDDGLCLLDDLTIGEAKLKENYVDIPGGNGSLNLSYAPQGYPVYEDREISFTLFKGVDDVALEATRAKLANMFHGQEVDLYLPNDPKSCWTGVIQFGAISGYNSGKIPVKFRAQPYKINRSTGVKSL